MKEAKGKRKNERGKSDDTWGNMQEAKAKSEDTWGKREEARGKRKGARRKTQEERGSVWGRERLTFVQKVDISPTNALKIQTKNINKFQIRTRVCLFLTQNHTCVSFDRYMSGKTIYTLGLSDIRLGFCHLIRQVSVKSDKQLLLCDTGLVFFKGIRHVFDNINIMK